jgi:thioredoxin-like negative regulator of GroEL
VNGVKEEMAGKVDVVHLNLVSAVGREVGGRYGVRVVPTSLLFNSDGDLVTRVNGVPKKDDLISEIQ